MLVSAPPRNLMLSRSVRRLVGMLVLAACVCASGCTSRAPRVAYTEPAPPPAPPPESASSPKTWVYERDRHYPRERHHPIWWWLWSEVRDYLGEAEWKSIDVSWMPALARSDLDRARTDLAKVHATWRHQDEFMVGGLWRLALEREATLQLLSAHDGDAAWPLTKPEKGRRFDLLWRPRLERWYRTQPAGEAAKNLRAKLAESWREAVASKDARLAATVVEAMDERFGRASGEALASEGRSLIRETISVLEARIRARPGYVFSYELPIGLMERFGVPEQLVLKPFVDGTRHRAAELAGEPIPFPHPYDFDLLILRLERLLDQHR